MRPGAPRTERPGGVTREEYHRRLDAAVAEVVAAIDKAIAEHVVDAGDFWATSIYRWACSPTRQRLPEGQRGALLHMLAEALLPEERDALREMVGQGSTH